MGDNIKIFLQTGPPLFESARAYVYDHGAPPRDVRRPPALGPPNASAFPRLVSVDRIYFSGRCWATTTTKTTTTFPKTFIEQTVSLSVAKFLAILLVRAVRVDRRRRTGRRKERWFSEEDEDVRCDDAARERRRFSQTTTTTAIRRRK